MRTADLIRTATDKDHPRTPIALAPLETALCRLPDTRMERALVVLLLLAGSALGGVLAALDFGLVWSTGLVLLAATLSMCAALVRKQRQADRWPAFAHALDAQVIPSLQRALTYATAANECVLARQTLDVLRRHSADLPRAPQTQDPVQMAFLRNAGTDNLERVAAYLAAKTCPINPSGVRTPGFYFHALQSTRPAVGVNG